MSDDDAMWAPPDAAQALTVGDMFRLAKTLRIKVYYDQGDSDAGDDPHTGAVREGRTSALASMADAIDETFKFDSILTQDDLARWRR